MSIALWGNLFHVLIYPFNPIWPISFDVGALFSLLQDEIYIFINMFSLCSFWADCTWLILLLLPYDDILFGQVPNEV